MALDYGRKRTGIAVTDSLQLIATGLETIETDSVIWYLKQYFQREEVEKVLIGYPLNLDDTPTDATPLVEKFIRNFQKVFPSMPIEKIDERMSSKIASQAIAVMGLKKKDREKKALIDEVSAVILLQEYLETRTNS